MKLTVTKQELQKKLSDIQNVVEKRNTMPILSHFLLNAVADGGGGGGSTLTATDLETAIREPIELSVQEEGKLSIPARKLFEIVKEVEGDISLSSDGDWLRVKAGASNFRLACLSPDDFPVWPEMEEADEVRIEARTLAEIIEKTIYAAGESDTRYTLNGLLFHFVPDGNELNVVGTDGHRMAVIKRTLGAVPSEEKKLIVPRKAAAELRKFLDMDGDAVALFGQNHALFKAGEVEFLARLIEGTYPNYSQVLPENNDKKVTADRDGLMRAMRRVSIMSRERSSAIKVDFTENLMTLSSSNPDLGEARDELAIEYSGEELSMGFNARYFLDALGSMSAEKVTLELQDPLSPTLIKEEGNEDYRCVVMPMRV